MAKTTFSGKAVSGQEWQGGPWAAGGVTKERLWGTPEQWIPGMEGLLSSLESQGRWQAVLGHPCPGRSTLLTLSTWRIPQALSEQGFCPSKVDC